MSVPSLIALIPAAGSGARFGSATPKQYSLLAGRPLLTCTIERLAQGLQPDLIAVVLAESDQHFATLGGLPSSVRPLYCGGETRAQSVFNGLKALAEQGAVTRQTWVAVHDAARPCVPISCLAALREWAAQQPQESQAGALLALPVSDTLKEADGDGLRVVATHDRSRFWRAQTPQCFRFGVLLAALAEADDTTDEAQAVERWCTVHNVPLPQLLQGADQNLKVTYPDDLQLAAAVLSLQQGEST